MKNVIKSFALVFCISLIFGSCSDSIEISESQDSTLIQPLPDNGAMSDIIITDEDKLNSTFEMPEFTIATRSNCPAFDYAQSQYSSVNSNCNYGYLYCEYLKLFWQLEFHIAAINCGWSIFCQPTCGAFQTYANNKIIDLAEDGLHPIYLQSLGNRILAHDNLCDNC